MKNIQNSRRENNDLNFSTVLLMLASQRIESVMGSFLGTDDSGLDDVPTKRGAGPTLIEWFILSWVSGKWSLDNKSKCFLDFSNVIFSFCHFHFSLIYVKGLIWSEVKQLWDVGLQEYINDMWNVIDFITNSLYVATVALRVVSYFQVSIFCNTPPPRSLSI
jgi:transient receptor potential cation channel subfamily C protein 4